MHGLLIVVASLVAEHKLRGHGIQELQHSRWLQLLGSRGQAKLMWHMSSVVLGTWDLLSPGIKPKSPALTGGFFTTGPPGKSLCMYEL